MLQALLSTHTPAMGQSLRKGQSISMHLPSLQTEPSGQQSFFVRNIFVAGLQQHMAIRKHHANNDGGAKCNVVEVALSSAGGAP